MWPPGIAVVLCLGIFCAEVIASGISFTKATGIVVKKADRKMMLYENDKLLKTYKISLGRRPIGHKVQEGDYKTPEGLYTISYKNAQSECYKSLKISYPNKIDRQNAKKLGVSPGGNIMIHGVGKYFAYIKKIDTPTDWTFGCVAVTDEEIDEIWKMVDVGTPIQIDP